MELFVLFYFMYKNILTRKKQRRKRWDWNRSILITIGSRMGHIAKQKIHFKKWKWKPNKRGSVLYLEKKLKGKNQGVVYRFNNASMTPLESPSKSSYWNTASLIAWKTIWASPWVGLVRSVELILFTINKKFNYKGSAPPLSRIEFFF